MRIISGTFRGKKILEPKDFKTRPLKDLTKESIFNIIRHSKKLNVNLEESYVLDLFSGVGSFGLECLSRGAKKVVFFENYKNALDILKKNLTNLKTAKNYEIFENNIYQLDSFSKFSIKFDIIFLDPPYKEKNLLGILERIKSNELLKPNGVLILHRHKNEIDTYLNSFNIIEIKKYGISKIIFFSF